MSGAAPSGVDVDVDATGAVLALTELIEQHEATDWSDIPDVSAAEAAAWTQRLIEARDRVEGGV
jgi:hypothetical protein